MTSPLGENGERARSYRANSEHLNKEKFKEWFEKNNITKVALYSCMRLPLLSENGKIVDPETFKERGMTEAEINMVKERNKTPQYVIRLHME